MRSAAPVTARSIGAAVVAAAVVLGGAATGCAPSRPAAPSASVPSVGAIATLATADGQALPIAPYLISPDEDRRIEAARTALIGSCMKRFGFDYAPPALGEKPDLMTRRYYLTDAASAAVRGYHRDDRPDGGEQAPPPQAVSPEMQTVLGRGRAAPAPDGSTAPAGGTYRGIAVPEGGCLGEADDALAAGGGTIQDDPAASEINGRSFEASMADGRVKAAFADWSRCMKEKGHSYGTPVDAVSDKRWLSSPTATEPEIAAATADVECKRRTNVVGIWFAVETAYQSRDVRANLPHLQQARKAVDTALANAAAAAPGGGAPTSP